MNSNHSRIYQARRRKKHRALAPVLLLLLILVLAAGLIFGAFQLFGHARAHAEAGHYAVELDDGWTAGFLTPTATDAQKALIDSALEEVSALGGDTVLWTARSADGATLFRTKRKSVLQISDTVTANDSLLSKFDPLDYMVSAANKRNIAVVLLATDSAGNELDAESINEACAEVTAAAKKHGLLLAGTTASQDSSTEVGSALTLYPAVRVPSTETEVTFARCDASPAKLATAAEEGVYTNFVLGSLTALLEDSAPAKLLCSLIGTSGADASGRLDLTALIGEKTISQSLALTYPTATVYTESCFLMGTSDPSLPLTIAGGTVGEAAELPRFGTKGVWGYLVSLAEGDNVFTLSQAGGDSLTVTVTRAVSTYQPAKPTSDGSVPAVWGQKLQISGTAAASALSDYGNADTINGTFYEGAVATAYDSVQFEKSGKLTYAYQVATGDWVFSQNVQLLDVDTPDAAFTGIASTEDPETNCTLLQLQGSGTPALYHTFEDNALALTFLNATMDEGAAESLADSFITSATIENGETSFTLTLTFAADDPLYGWSVDYGEDSTTIALKHSPKLSDAETGPLTGVRILLDPGHGDQDNGAMGAAGSTAPVEKDLNLAEAWAVKTRLEQLGATVTMTREDDTFYTLSERLALLRSRKPDFFLSLHHNSAALVNDINGSGGTEAYWFYTESKPLAERLVGDVCAATGRDDRGAHYNYFFVTRSNICPAILLETGFVTDPAEYENCSDVEMIWRESAGIAQSVLECVAGGNLVTGGETALPGAAVSAVESVG